jgi:nickel-dependent lactate racemase
MNNSKKAVVPVLAWYGDEELELEFPESWDITVCKMKGHEAPPLSDAAIRKAFANPIGTKTIKELAKGKKEVAILFDDMSRATPTAVLIPYVLEELAASGIPDDNIRFIAAIGAHGSMNGIDFRKKLGDDVMGRFLVYNHNPYENCTPLGLSSQGTPMSINSEFMACDLRIGIGSIVPHPYGFGGGSKIILPGIASMETIVSNHNRLALNPTVAIGKLEGNLILQDIVEAARMAGLDVKVDAIINMKREVTALSVGDVVEEHIEGVKLAAEHYATDMVRDADIVVANCFAKANEMCLAPGVASPLLSPNGGGDMVLIVVTPEGQINHYFDRSFGRNLGGQGWGPLARKTALPKNTKKLTIMAPYSDKVGADWVAPYELVSWAKTWQEVIQDLRNRYGNKAKVAVIPDATMQYFPEAMGK